MIVHPLGGAYRRPGTIFCTTLDSQKVKLISFQYAPGKSCVILFSEAKIDLYGYRSAALGGDSAGRLLHTEIPYEDGDYLIYEDFKDLKHFTLENRIYFYVNKREGGPTSGFWTIELIPGSQFSFQMYKGIQFAPGPKVPPYPSRLLEVRYNQSSHEYSFTCLDEEGQEDPNMFSEKDIDRKISFKFTNPSTAQYAGVYWPEVKIEGVEDGRITSATISAGSTNVAPVNNSFTVREWLISAFDGSADYGGRLGDPATMSLYQGRLYIGKNSYIFASKLTDNPLCFALGADEDDGFVQRITSGNMGDIYWMGSMDKLIVGANDGLYLIGNAQRYAEPITLSTFVATKIKNVGSSKLPAIISEESVIFVSNNNKTVYEVITTSDGQYSVSAMNEYSLDLARSGIIDHAWQQSPYPVYWAVTQDGALVGCTFDKTAPYPLRYKWHDHVLGGYNAYITQIEKTTEDFVDIMWFITKRENYGEEISYLEFLAPPFDPVNQDVIDQMYLDCAKVISHRYTIKNLHNGTESRVVMNMEDFVQLKDYFNLNRDKMIIVIFRNGDIDHIYDEPLVNFYAMNETGFMFDVGGYLRQGLISEEHKDVLMESCFLIPVSMVIYEIINVPAHFVNEAVYIRVNNTIPLSSIENPIIYLKNTGFEQLDERIFRPINMGAGGFFLGDENYQLVSIDLSGGELTDSGYQIFLGKSVFPEDILMDSPRVTFSSNIFNEEVTDANDPELYHKCRIYKVYGATGYNGEEFFLKLVAIDPDESTYTYTMYWGAGYHADDPTFNFVAAAYANGVYDMLKTDNGLCYFYFDSIEASEIAHLFGQRVTYTLNGNWSFLASFVLDEESVVNGRIYLSKPAIIIAIGLPFVPEVMVVPASGGSLFGSSEGCVGSQKQVVLMMYASLGGKYGPSIPTYGDGSYKLLNDIPYPYPDEVDKTRSLITAAIKVPIWGNKDPTIRSVYLRNDEPMSFNVLSIIQDINVSDG
jgi:hypothetical protein